MSDSMRPHRRQPTRLPRPWDSPGKNTGVGCHLQPFTKQLLYTLHSDIRVIPANRVLYHLIYISTKSIYHSKILWTQIINLTFIQSKAKMRLELHGLSAFIVYLVLFIVIPATYICKHWRIRLLVYPLKQSKFYQWANKKKCGMPSSQM